MFISLQQHAGWRTKRSLGAKDERIEVAARTVAEIAEKVAEEVAEDAVAEIFYYLHVKFYYCWW